MRTNLLRAATASVLAAVALAVPAAAESGQTYTGVLDGAPFRVEVPRQWNGTLVLFSHGYYPPGWAPEHVELGTAPGAEQALLDEGYALAASNYRDSGFVMEHAVTDQVALLDWFTDTVGAPRRTLSSGMSMGGGIAVMLAERHPDRFDGVLAQCADLDYPGNWNTALDVSFVVRTLLASEDIDLVLARDPAESTALLTRAAEAAQATPEGRARLALAGAVGNIPGWATAFEPEPTEPAERLRQQSAWVVGAYLAGLGPQGRTDLEARAGGNPSWNTGVDYRRQLARSDYRDLAIGAYRDAGLDLRADLDALAEAPRIAADPAARAYLSRVSPTGRTADPVLTMHNSADGGSINGQDRWYAQQARPGLVRMTAVDRGSHCAFNAAEEVTALHTLESRVDTGRWPTLNQRALNAAARARADFLVRDLFTGESRAMPPAFTHPNPDRHLRPTR